MISQFFSESIKVNTKSRQQKQKLSMLRYMSTSVNFPTIPQLAKHVRISVPTATSLINELVDNDWVVEVGKKKTINGRKPTLYGINQKKFHVVGLEIGLKRLRIVVSRIDLSILYKDEFDDFTLKDTEACLMQVFDFINYSIKASGIDRELVMGVGIGITGRVNTNTGESLNYFNFMGKPFGQIMQDRLNLNVYVDNDTRTMGIAEQVLGIAKGIDNVLIVNVSQGLGLSMILNRELVTGAKGYAGEFGHMQFGQMQRLCICGKIGCLGTEVSGHALEQDMNEALLKGSTSLFFSKESKIYNYYNILSAVNKGDLLAIELIHGQGQKLGQALGGILNLLNPELIVISGDIAKVAEFYLDAVKIGLRKTALLNPLKHCSVIASKLGDDSGVMGGASLVLKQFQMI